MRVAACVVVVAACSSPAEDRKPLPWQAPTPVLVAGDLAATQQTRKPRGAMRLSPAQDFGKRDLLSPDAFAGNNNRDFAFDLAIDAPKRIRHLLVVVHGRGQQWDTVIGREPTPGFSELPDIEGARTWHLGVQAHGRWLTRSDGSLPMLQSGHHELRLYADISGGYTQFTAYAQLEDGSYLRAETQTPAVR